MCLLLGPSYGGPSVMKIIIKNLIIVSYKIGINKLVYKLMYSSFFTNSCIKCIYKFVNVFLNDVLIDCFMLFLHYLLMD